MGVYSTKLYDLLPQYARYLDDRGILQHFCSAIQPEIDYLYSIIRNQSRYYDPRLTDDRFLDFLQQFVGGATDDDKWLGIGLNPEWSGYHKRRVIEELWTYWQIKGTERGIRKAIALWLQQDQARTSKVYIRLPLSKFPTEAPNSWFAWGDAYDSHLCQDYEDRQFFGAGDFPGVEYRPDYFTARSPIYLWEWGDLIPDSEPLPLAQELDWTMARWDAPRVKTLETYPVEFGIGWSDRFLSSELAPLVNDEASHLGARRPWQHLFLDQFQWNQVFHDIFDLNPQIYPALAVPTTFGWLELSNYIKPLLLIEDEKTPQYRTFTEIEIDGAQFGVLSDSSTTTPGTVPGSTLHKEPKPSYATHYPNYDPIYEAGDWWPFQVQDAYDEIQYRQEVSHFGVWSPDWWDGMWWGSAISPSDQGLLVPSAPDEIGELEVEVLELAVPTINLDRINFGDAWGRPAAELWYLPWGEHIEQVPYVVHHPGSGCAPGLIAEIDEGMILPTIDLGGTDIGTNLVLSGDPPAIDVLQIANYFGYDSYEYYRKPDEDVRPVYIFSSPIAVPEISMPLTIEVPAIDRTRVQLCNVFKNWSTGEILRLEDYKEEVSVAERGLFEVYPLIESASNMDNWQLLVEAVDEIYVLKPTTAFWRNTFTVRGEEEYFLSEYLGRKFYGGTRSQFFSFEQGHTNLHLEFVFRPKKYEKVRAVSLYLNDEQVAYQSHYEPLNFPVDGCYGFKLFVPFTLPTGATRPDDELAIIDILPGLREQFEKLTGEGMYDQSLNMEGLRATMTQIRDGLATLIARPVGDGDLNYQYAIESPALQLKVRHGLGKQPSVTFSADDGYDAEIDVYRDPTDKSTVVVYFSKPAKGILYFN